jgi:diguanylate cyclase (GGDEF)-like protein
LEAISRIATDALSRAIDHAESENRALTDPMTGLPNARSLQIQFEKEAARAQRTKREFQVLMFDLDEFKKVNDTFGHKVGDLLLRELSKVMRLQLREYDFLARYAGDEFVAILPEITEERALELCNRMEKTVLDFRLPVGDKFARVGISIGSAAYPSHGETLDQVLIAADRMMYSVKATHKEVRQRAEEVANKIREEKARPLPPMKHLDIIETQSGGNIILDRPIEIPVAEIIMEDNLILEIDEQHIVSNAVN